MTDTQQKSWKAFDYEVQMFNFFHDLVIVQGHQGEPVNEKRWAYTECLVLHTRILCEIFVGSQFADNIQVSTLVPGLQISESAEFNSAYGDGKVKNTPRYDFNKRLAHPTTVRADSYNYTAHVQVMEPLLRKAIAEISSRRPT